MSGRIPEPVESHDEVRPGRKPRADGIERRRAILLAAANLATTRGLDVLSIGELAEQMGMSKSGLYAHFKSKEELELATIDTATEVFERDVLMPASVSPGGLTRVHALCEAFLSHLERRVFSGGCFFAAVSVQLAANPGRPRDRVLAIMARWAEQFVQALDEAITSGELPRGSDINQLVFEITAMLVRANFSWVQSGGIQHLEQARVGVRHVLESAARRSDHQTRTSQQSPAQTRSRSRARA